MGDDGKEVRARLSKLKNIGDEDLAAAIQSAVGRLVEMNLPRIKAGAIEGETFGSTIDLEISVGFGKSQIRVTAGGEVRPSPWKKVSTSKKW